MDQQFAQEMKAQLEAEKADLQKELDAVSSEDIGDHVPGERAPKFPNYGDDNYEENSESPVEVADYAENVNATGVLEQKAKDVDSALSRIADGSYGTCASCGGDIAEERLKANPAAAKCINCAKSHTS